MAAEENFKYWWTPCLYTNVTTNLSHQRWCADAVLDMISNVFGDSYERHYYYGRPQKKIREQNFLGGKKLGSTMSWRGAKKILA